MKSKNFNKVAIAGILIDGKFALVLLTLSDADHNALIEILKHYDFNIAEMDPALFNVAALLENKRNILSNYATAINGSKQFSFNDVLDKLFEEKLISENALNETKAVFRGM